MNVSAKKKCRPEQKVRPALKWRSHIFYEQCPAEDIKSLQCLTMQPHMHPFDERKPFIKRYFESSCAEKKQEIKEHYLRPPEAALTVSISSSFFNRKLSRGSSCLRLSTGSPLSLSALIQSSSSLVLGFFFSSKYSRT